MNDTEARLRGALEKIAGSHWERVGHCQTDVDEVPDLTAEDAMREARKALSAHPHASDCDKQGEAVKPRVEAQPIKALQMPEYRFQDIDNRR